MNYYAHANVTCYLLRGKNGDLLIDTGIQKVKRGLFAWLEQFQPKWVFLTHAHPDHDWNAAALQKQGMKIILHENDRTLRGHFGEQPLYATHFRWEKRNIMLNIGGRLLKSPAYTPDIVFGDGDTGLLRELGFDADIVPLPGHTLGSCGIYSRGILYCGDAFTALFHRPDITPHACNLQKMRTSLHRILKLNPEVLACGHGLPVRMQEARPVIEEYLKE